MLIILILFCIFALWKGFHINLKVGKNFTFEWEMELIKHQIKKIYD